MRPIWIQKANLVVPMPVAVASPFELPLKLLNPDEYARLPLKTLTSAWPMALYNDLASPVSNVVLYPTPTVSGLQVALYVAIPLGRFADLSTEYSLPPGCDEAIGANLAIRLCRPFGKPLTPDLMKDAADALADFKRPNLQYPILDIDPAYRGSRAYYDIYSDDWRDHWR
jgi:hypothetical protein